MFVGLFAGLILGLVPGVALAQAGPSLEPAWLVPMGLGLEGLGTIGLVALAAMLGGLLWRSAELGRAARSAAPRPPANARAGDGSGEGPHELEIVTAIEKLGSQSGRTSKKIEIKDCGEVV